MKTESEARELIALAIGQASMCWETLEIGGIFQSEKAVEIIEELLIDLELKDTHSVNVDHHQV